MPDNFWPEDITASTVRPPVAILKEQASLLGKKTNNVVEGLVSELATLDEQDRIEHVFSLVAPALGGYRYRLFTMGHDIRMYPLTIRVDSENYNLVNPKTPDKETVADRLRRQRNEFKVDNEPELKDLLKKIFATRKTRQIIGAMLAQSST